jgi:PAS domain S-box-containing protein
MQARPEGRQAEQLALLVESVSDYAIFLLDPHGHVATWNRGAQRIKGYRADEIIGQHFSVFYTEPERAADHPGDELVRALRDGSHSEEGWRVRKDGTTFWASVVITAVHDDDHELIGFAKVTRDLTERRKGEEALRAAQERLRQANAELDRFAVVAAHDLSEPLTTVHGFAALLAARHADELSPRGREFLDQITAATDRMQRLISTLLEYARAGRRLRPSEPIDVRAATQVVLAGLDASVQRRQATVDVRMDDDVRVMADRSGVELVMQNLISNALKFGDPHAPRVTVEAERQADAWRIVVSDNGAGVGAEDRVRIFQAFERADPGTVGGTGLGLAICERIVRRLDGTLGLDSEVGRGSRFWITLPAASDA